MAPAPGDGRLDPIESVRLYRGISMTAAEKWGLIIGSVGTAAAIIAAWASVAERLEKRNERRALKLTSIEEALLYIASQVGDEQIRAGCYLGGSGLLVSPGLNGGCLVIETEAPLKRLVISEYMVFDHQVQHSQYGPSLNPPQISFMMVNYYRLTLKGRERANQVSASVATNEISNSGLKGDY